METTNSPVKVQGSYLQFERNDEHNKDGRRAEGPSKVDLITNNGAANLCFYAVGESLAADTRKEHEYRSKRLLKS